MVDILTTAQRSKRMSIVPHKDTKVEKTIRSILHRNGFRFRKNVKKLPGTPDIVLPKYKAIIFVHGCFWHGHVDCKKSRLPVTNLEFWKNKRQKNIARDARKMALLIDSGWRISIVWQCALKNSETLSRNIDALQDWIMSTDTFLELP